jgi:uncharacterized protein YndB with AHSA1/START domain
MARPPSPHNEALTGFATSPAPGMVRLERAYPANAETLWSYLTDSHKRRDWWAAGKMDLRKDGVVDLTWYFDELSPFEDIPPRYATHGDGHRQTGRITRIEPPHRLAFTWGQDSEVTFELEPRSDGTVLALTHRRLEDRPGMIRVASGWFTHMLLLEDAILGRERRPFWHHFSLAQEEHEKLLGEPPLVLKLVRRFRAKPSAVFDAFLASERPRLWMFGQDGTEILSAENDAQPGGRLSVIENRDGAEIAHTGSYGEIVRPHRIAYSFGLPDFSPELDRVRVELGAENGGTVLVLVHEMRPIWADYSDRAELGWVRVLAQVAAELEGKGA